MGIRVGIDTGGTFTDLVAVDDRDGSWHIAKVPSNPSSPVAAIGAALERAEFEAADIDFVVVGTTIGINAVLTRTGSRVVYLTTKGFEDIPYIQRINRKHHYDFHWRKPSPLVRRHDCVGVDERVGSDGEVRTALSPAEVQNAVRELIGEAGRPVAVACCFLFSYLNADAELAAREAIGEIAPELAVSLSHEVAPIWREYERGTATILDAYIKPVLDNYVDDVTKAFVERGASESWSLLKSNGGHALAAEARRRPSHVLLSGIAGGAIGGAYFAEQAGIDRAIVVDMGGTSCDVCLIVNGQPLYSSEYELEFGLPVSVPTIHTHTIGAGGGSIGWVDPGGFLQVGPQSAGADPGPACYDAGGTEPTMTDANLLLGRLNPDYFLGGQLQLKPELSGRAIRLAAERLDDDELSIASSMVRIANESMANAIRIVTIEQGIDPRDFAIVAMGGAGAMHACGIAEALGIDRVLVPPHPGLTSAFGALAAPVRVDEVQSVAWRSNAVHPSDVRLAFDDLERRANASFAAQGAGNGKPVLTRYVGMRYEGQNYEQEVPLPNGAVDEEMLVAAYESYHARHQEFYGYRFDRIPMELVRLSVTVSGSDPSLPALTGLQDRDRRARTTDVYFEEAGFQPTAVVRRADVDELARSGPLIIESMDTTVVVPPEWAARGTPDGLIMLEREASNRNGGEPQ